jgi:UDP-N-acetylglucosamine pyrophosphorylase
MKKFADAGKNIMFISNVENLGAEVDTSILKIIFQSQISLLLEILSFFAESPIEFLLEVTHRISSDNRVRK